MRLPWVVKDASPNFEERENENEADGDRCTLPRLVLPVGAQSRGADAPVPNQSPDPDAKTQHHKRPSTKENPQKRNNQPPFLQQPTGLRAIVQADGV